MIEHWTSRMVCTRSWGHLGHLLLTWHLALGISISTNMMALPWIIGLALALALTLGLALALPLNLVFAFVTLPN